VNFFSTAFSYRFTVAFDNQFVHAILTERDTIMVRKQIFVNKAKQPTILLFGEGEENDS
jgi:hypothetical protein